MATRKGYRTTVASSPASPGRRLTLAGIIAIGADTALNAGGMWAVVLNLNDTDTYQMFAKSFDFGSTSMRMLPALLIALALGYVLCIAPHKLWHYDGEQQQQTRRRIAAFVAAAGGWYTTYLFIAAIGVPGLWAYAVSAGCEWLLFEFKREIL